MKRLAQRLLDHACHHLAVRDGWSAFALLLVLAVPIVALLTWLL